MQITCATNTCIGRPGSAPPMSIPALLLSSFVIAVTALLFFIWSLRKGLMDPDPAAARVIFAEGEVGAVEEPAVAGEQERGLQRALHTRAPTGPSRTEIEARLAADRSTADAAFVLLAFAVFWLVLGSFAGLTSSIKLHAPDW